MQEYDIEGDKDETRDKEGVDSPEYAERRDEEDGDGGSRDGGSEIDVGLAAIFAENGEETRNNHSGGIKDGGKDNELQRVSIKAEI